MNANMTESKGGIAALIVNLGTPEATDYWSIRRYLKEFLWDRRVVEMPRPLWWLILNGVILTFRPKRSGRAYDRIWNHEQGESPLKTITRSQAQKLAQSLSAAHPGLLVDWAMRYGKPSIEERITELHAQGAERILLFPLYPQYSATTTASVVDKAAEALMKMRAQPSLRSVPPFPDDPLYITALRDSIQNQIAAMEEKPEDLLLSFHGLPESYVEKGDPYQEHCQRSAKALRRALDWPQAHFHIAFQSRVGRAEWLRPYTEETIAALARKGVRNLAVVTPGFIADCVETLEEIAIGGAETFRANGGQNLTCLACLNDSDPAISMLRAIIDREISGWV